MSKASKRKPDMRRVRPTKVYTMPEIADALDRSIETVRRWVQDGLPVLDDRRPILVDGFQLKKWLKDRWQSRKRPCAPGEYFCFRCRAPRMPVQGSVVMRRRNRTTVILQAVCAECGGSINKLGSSSKCSAEREQLPTLSIGITHLSSSAIPGEEAGNKTKPQANKVEAKSSAQFNLDFDRSEDG